MWWWWLGEDGVKGEHVNTVLFSGLALCEKGIYLLSREGFCNRVWSQASIPLSRLRTVHFCHTVIMPASLQVRTPMLQPLGYPHPRLSSPKHEAKSVLRSVHWLVMANYPKCTYWEGRHTCRVRPYLEIISWDQSIKPKTIYRGRLLTRRHPMSSVQRTSSVHWLWQ